MEVVKKLGIIAAGLCVTTAGFSATQGNLGTTSTGSVNISLTIPQLVKISGLNDIELGTISTGPATGAAKACIYSNTTSGSYTINVMGNGEKGAFTVSSGGSSPTPILLRYTATWTPAKGTAVDLAPNTASTTITGANNTSVNCSGSTNATFAVTFSEDAIAAVPAATYKGTATLLISPA